MVQRILIVFIYGSVDSELDPDWKFKINKTKTFLKVIMIAGILISLGFLYYKQGSSNVDKFTRRYFDTTKHEGNWPIIF